MEPHKAGTNHNQAVGIDKNEHQISISETRDTQQKQVNVQNAVLFLSSIVHSVQNHYCTVLLS